MTSRVIRPVGRPEIQMWRDRDEQDGVTKRERKCTKCFKSGRNRTMCKGAPANASTEGPNTCTSSHLRPGESRERGGACASRGEGGADVSRGRGGAYNDDTTFEDLSENGTGGRFRWGGIRRGRRMVRRRRLGASTQDKTEMAHSPTSPPSQPSHQSEVTHREKLMYWTQFKFVHFLTILPKNPHLQLGFPKKFIENLKEELLENVELNGPSGHTWNVVLAKSGDDLFLQDGWHEFVKDHNLKEKDVLLFKYKRESRFDVLMFDESLSEIESTYFVRKSSGLNNHQVNGKRTERGAELSVEVIRPVKRLKEQHREQSIERPQLRASRVVRRQTESSSRAILVPDMVEDDEETYEDLNPGYPLHFVSKRRSVTEAEESRAKELADRAAATSNKPNFVVVMHPTHVSYRFYLTIPMDFARSYLPRKNEDVILSMDGKRWGVKYYIYKRKMSSAIHGSGWADFVLENNLEVGDVCLFETSDRKQSIALNVRIFRVVKEVVPLKKVTIPMTKRGK